MRFDHYQYLMANMFKQQSEETGAFPVNYTDIPVHRLPPLVLAYVGDAYFTLYVRTRLLSYEQNKVRVLHDCDAKMVSAVMQARAYKALEATLSEEEIAVVKRGRNAKSSVPKSATVAEYRYSTGFEALLGYLYLKEDYRRLVELVSQAFDVISREMTKTGAASPQ